MAIESIASVKSKFETGDTPSQADFIDFIDTVGRGSMLAVASGVEGGGVGVVSFTTAATVEFHLVASAGSTILGTESISSVQTLLSVPTSAVGETDDNNFTGTNSFAGITTFSTAVTINATASVTQLNAAAIRVVEASASAMFIGGLQARSAHASLFAADAYAAAATKDVTGLTNFMNAQELRILSHAQRVGSTGHLILTLGDATDFTTGNSYFGQTTDESGVTVVAWTSNGIVVGNQTLSVDFDWEVRMVRIPDADAVTMFGASSQAWKVSVWCHRGDGNANDRNIGSGWAVTTKTVDRFRLDSTVGSFNAQGHVMGLWS